MQQRRIAQQSPPADVRNSLDAQTAGPAHAGTALLVAAGGFFLTTLDLLIVNLALPSISGELGGGTSAAQWVIDGYTLLFAALLLAAGNLSDRLGARRAFAGGIAGFMATSALCTMAPSMWLLLVGRAGQGAAAALMLPASMALVREAFPGDRQRAWAVGVWASGGAVAAAAGPLLGGILTSWDWRLVFAVNIPVCVVMLLALTRVAASPTRQVPFDRVGQILALIGLSALILGLIEAGSRGYSDPLCLLSFAVAAASLAAFFKVEAITAHPMMPLTLFDDRGMRIALVGGFAFIASWFGTVFLASLYLQHHLSLDPVPASLLFLPSAALSFVGNLSSGFLSNHFGPRLPAVLGLSAMTLGLTLMIVIAPQDIAWLIAIVVALVGTGGSLATPTLTSLVMSSSGVEQVGVASAVFNTVRQIGGALAIALFGTLIAGPLGFIRGLQISFAIAGALGLIALLACTRIPKANPPELCTFNPTPSG